LSSRRVCTPDERAGGLGAPPARGYSCAILCKLSRLSLLLLLGCCSRGADPGEHDERAAAARGAIVARVGQAELREEDLKQALAREPGTTPERFASPAAKREFVDGLIRFELLAQAADRAGFTKDPDAIHALRQIAVTKLVNKTLGAAGSPETISRADVEREYLARQASEFTLPEAAGVHHLRVSDAKLAERLVAQARTLAPTDERGFSTLASSAAKGATTRATGGDLGFIDKNSRLPPALVEAALSLKTPGEVIGPIETDSGYEILRLVSRRAAAVSPFSSVEESIRQRLYRERRAKALDDFIARLRAETPVQIVAPKSASKDAG
jgi:peptidyl-prolyl cis-trans isomerase C